MTVAHLLIRTAQLWDQKIALVDAQRSLSITFGEFVHAALSFGQQLLGRGLALGDRVALLGDATPEYLCTDYGGKVRWPCACSTRSQSIGR